MATADLRPVEYLVPADVGEAADMKGAGARVLAGGTDFYPAHVGRPFVGSVVDIAGLRELRGISIVEGSLRIGALTRWADVATAALPGSFDGLRAAARKVGSVQVQNAGTVGGNLCNASPAADGIPPLLTLDASVELTSTAGRACCRSRSSSPGTGGRRSVRRVADRGARPRGSTMLGRRS